MFKNIGFFLLLVPTFLVAQSLDKVIAVINQDVITEQELNEQVDTMKKQLEAKKVALPSETALKKQVLQHLIDVNLQLQLAKSNNINIDQGELDKAIEQIAESNHLNLTTLREAVIQHGMSWSQYRENIRKEMMMQQIQQKAIGNEIAVSSEQVEDYLHSIKLDKSKYTYKLQNIVVPLPEEPTVEQLSKAQQKARELLKKVQQGEDFSRLAIQESSGEFALEGGDLGERQLAELPEVFANKVLKMKVGDVAGPIRTGNGFQLIKLIAANGQSAHHEVTKTHVRHILIKQDASTTKASAEKQIQNLYQQLQSGKDFAVMAKQYSVDAASAIHGGDLGWVTSDELVPQFAEAMDHLPINKISHPVKTPFGWHIIQVLARKTMDDSDAYQRQQVRKLLQQRKFTEAVQNWQQHLRADAYIQIMDKRLA